MQDWQEWNEIPGNPIATDAAWRMFADWKAGKKEVGLRFVSQLSRFGPL
jgi:hypothetical protein